jgi:SAM-dependent methyltransferase
MEAQITLYSRFDRTVRKLIPSVGKVSYNPLVKMVGNAIASALSLPFPELKELPPNHLRIRIGVGNRILANHVHFLEMGSGAWLDFLARQLCTASSDVVELGCGCGRIARPLKGAWFKGTYVGVDLDSEMIHYCRAHFPRDKFSFVLSPHRSETYSSGHLSKSTVNTKKLRVADTSSKDFVFSISLYSHLLEAEFNEYLQESARILRPGGMMYLSFFCMDHVELGRRWTFGYKLGSSHVENTALPEAAVAYTQEYVYRAVQQVGFEDVTILPRSIQSVLIARKR